MRVIAAHSKFKTERTTSRAYSHSWIRMALPLRMVVLLLLTSFYGNGGTKFIHDCGELGIKRDLTQPVFYELVRPPMTASPSALLSPAQSLLSKISSQRTDGGCPDES